MSKSKETEGKRAAPEEREANIHGVRNFAILRTHSLQSNPPKGSEKREKVIERESETDMGYWGYRYNKVRQQLWWCELQTSSPKISPPLLYHLPPSTRNPNPNYPNPSYLTLVLTLNQPPPHLSRTNQTAPFVPETKRHKLQKTLIRNLRISLSL